VSGAEIVLENPSQEVMNRLQPYAHTIVRTGDRVRMEFDDEHDSNALLEKAVACGARIYSFNPVKSSLEDFFMSQVGAQAQPSRTENRESEVKVRTAGA
jgi:hypothetical protein